MLPAVETAKRRPAVRPILVTERERRRTAMGVTPAKTTLGIPKRITAATNGFARGPGSHITTQRRTVSSTTGIASTRSAARPITESSSLVAGSRSASAPPSQ
jgi:hypothetical protein